MKTTIDPDDLLRLCDGKDTDSFLVIAYDMIARIVRTTRFCAAESEDDLIQDCALNLQGDTLKSLMYRIATRAREKPTRYLFSSLAMMVSQLNTDAYKKSMEEREISIPAYLIRRAPLLLMPDSIASYREIREKAIEALRASIETFRLPKYRFFYVKVVEYWIELNEEPWGASKKAKFMRKGQVPKEIKNAALYHFRKTLMEVPFRIFGEVPRRFEA